jgi:hypothetical protein
MIHNSNPLDLALSKGKCEAVFITQVFFEFFHHICCVSTGSPWTRTRMVGTQRKREEHFRSDCGVQVASSASFAQ